ncbi:MAG TPA: carbohydrate-binding family 9-like protein [Terracidiphilus sp.]|nr:carbohydrate-binding family 9-like protein [Terracidiphilus sp.]
MKVNETIVASAADHRRTSYQHRAKASFSDRESGPDTDPDSNFWRPAPAAFAERDVFGQPVTNHATEIRALWTHDNLYFLFICPYLELNLKPGPQTEIETNELWKWDVAEVFIGSDFENIRRYKEFEISPQGEWVDLDIDLEKPHAEGGWLWNSGCQVAARIDRSKNTWYGFMRIPYSSIDSRIAAAGNLLRVNFFRSQGPESHRVEIAWQPTHNATFHIPDLFGTLELGEPKPRSSHDNR